MTQYFFDFFMLYLFYSLYLKTFQFLEKLKNALRNTTQNQINFGQPFQRTFTKLWSNCAN